MPFSPKFKVGAAPYSNLRQALQWIKDGINPVDPEYEPALGIDTWSSWDPYHAAPDYDYKKQKLELYLAICVEAIPLYGRPGIGAPKGKDSRDTPCLVNHPGFWLHRPSFWDDRPGPWFERLCIGAPRAEDSRDTSFWFDCYSDRERVPVSRLHEAGLEELDFRRSWIGKITEWDENHQSTKGWGYSELVVPTADLMRIFPEKEDPFAPVTEVKNENSPTALATTLPAPTILFLDDARDRIAEYTKASSRTAGIALHYALCGGELIAEAPNGEKVPKIIWRSFSSQQFLQNIETGITDWGMAKGLECMVDCINPCLRAVDVDLWLRKAAQEAAALERGPAEDDQPVEQPQDDQPAGEEWAPVGFGFRESEGRSVCDADPLPVYLQFLVEMVHLLGGRDCIASRRKKQVEAEIKARWRPELRLPSQNKIGTMAMILRPPEAQDGGAKPTRAAGSGTSSEG